MVVTPNLAWELVSEVAKVPVLLSTDISSEAFSLPVVIVRTVSDAIPMASVYSV